MNTLFFPTEFEKTSFSNRHGAGIYLAIHPTQPTLLNDEVTGCLQEVGAEVTLLDVIVLIATVSRPGPGPD